MTIISVENTLLLVRNHLISKSEITEIVSDRILTDHFFSIFNNICGCVKV